MVHARAAALRGGLQLRAQAQVGADAARDDQRVEAGRLQRAHGLGDQRVDHRLLERERDVGAVGLAGALGQGAHRMQHRGLEAREAELEPRPVEHRAREPVRARAPPLGETGEVRSAGIRQPEQLRALVEGLARGIVAGLAEQPVIADALRLDEHGVAARDQQRHVREGRRVGLERGREQVTLQMMHPHRRQPPGGSERAGERGPGQQRADQARAGRVGDAVEVGRTGIGVAQHPVDERQQALDMVPRGELGDHPAVDAVQFHLREERMRQQPPPIVEDGGGGLVAGGFEGKDAHGVLPFRARDIRIPAPASMGQSGVPVVFPYRSRL